MEETKYKTTIGLEIHAELKTKTKMFCKSLNDPAEKRPNANICPICMAHPGTLPVINKAAVKHVLRVGAALGGELATEFSEFDRKNYFYPDIPKGFQISQYKYPLVSGGSLNGIKITRVHLEEDTAKSYHFSGKKDTYLDFNRAGLPLMELVTEPVIHTAKEAGDFARELQLLLRYLGASEANMEKGQMRVEANISVSKTNEFGLNHLGVVGRTGFFEKPVLGTKVEVKNLNSFKSAEHAIEYEVKRHIEVLESGGKIIQETRGWDENTEKTFSQRVKEGSADYRYFPEPDLPKLRLKLVDDFKNIKNELPELPWEARKRFLDAGIPADQAEVMVIDRDFHGKIGDLILKKVNDKKVLNTAFNLLVTSLSSFVAAEKDLEKQKYFVTEDFVSKFIELVEMFTQDKISSRGMQDILKVMVEAGDSAGEPKKIAEEKGLFQKSDAGELKKICQEIIEENPKAVDEYKGGKEASLQFLVGQGMKKSKGSANPKILQEIFRELLK